MIRRACALWGVSALLLAALPAVGAEDLPLLIRSWPVAMSEAVSDSATFGRLRPRGMLQLPSFYVGDIRFSQLSALAWDDDDDILYALSDKGFLFHLRPIFENGALIGVTLLKAVHLTELNGKPLKKLRADSEGLDILNGRNGIKGDAELLVSFERRPRIMRYRPDGKALGELPLPAALAEPSNYHAANEMLESVCADPMLGVLTAPEMPLKNEPVDSTHIFSLSGKSWRYPATKGFGISAMECLGDGRVLVLERSFGHFFGRNAVALKQTTLPATPKSGELLHVTDIATLDLAAGHRIDNFEGLARHKENRFFMISDDNDLFVQRTLLLYVELPAEPAVPQ